MQNRIESPAASPTYEMLTDRAVEIGGKYAECKARRPEMTSALLHYYSQIVRDKDLPTLAAIQAVIEGEDGRKNTSNNFRSSYPKDLELVKKELDTIENMFDASDGEIAKGLMNARDTLSTRLSTLGGKYTPQPILYTLAEKLHNSKDSKETPSTYTPREFAELKLLGEIMAAQKELSETSPDTGYGYQKDKTIVSERS
jgi:hypothetical protein